MFRKLVGVLMMSYFILHTIIPCPQKSLQDIRRGNEERMAKLERFDKASQAANQAAIEHFLRISEEGGFHPEAVLEAQRQAMKVYARTNKRLLREM